MKEDSFVLCLLALVALLGLLHCNSRFRAEFFMNPAYTEDQLRYPAFVTERPLNFWTFCLQAAIVGLVGHSLQVLLIKTPSIHIEKPI